MSQFLEVSLLESVVRACRVELLGRCQGEAAGKKSWEKVRIIGRYDLYRSIARNRPISSCCRRKVLAMAQWFATLVVLSQVICCKSGSSGGGEGSSVPTKADAASDEVPRQDDALPGGSDGEERRSWSRGGGVEYITPRTDFERSQREGDEGEETPDGASESGGVSRSSLAREARANWAAKGVNSEILLDQGAGAAIPSGGLVALQSENPSCTFCHVSVDGDVASPVSPAFLMRDSLAPFARVSGRWYLGASVFDIRVQDADSAATKMFPLTLGNGAELNSLHPSVLKDADGDGVYDRPQLDFDEAQSLAQGTLRAPLGGVSIDAVSMKSVVLQGSAAQPIRISGDVLVKGDVVIYGIYEGLGTIYAEGNIYIPHNLLSNDRNMTFPYVGTNAQKRARAASDMAAARSGLGIYARKAIIVGDLESPLFDSPGLPSEVRRDALKLNSVTAWDAQFASRYGDGVSCLDGSTLVPRSFDRVDAALMAGAFVGGLSREGSFAVNGMVSAPVVALVARGGGRSRAGEPSLQACSQQLSPVHGRPMDRSYIHFDYRLQEAQSLRFVLLR